MSRKLTLFLNRYEKPLMWAGGVCTLLGSFFHRVISIPVLEVVFFVFGTIFAGIPILHRAVMGLKFKTVGIECLVSIAVIGAFFIGEFSEAAIVTFLFQFGSWLEQKTMKKTRSAIKELTKMAPDTAWRLDGDEAEQIDVDEVDVGDLLLVKTGGKIPVDGFVVSGEGSVNEASITGEPVPKSKEPGDKLYAGTILDHGTIKMEAAKVGEDTTFAKIIALVEEAQDAKSTAERFIDRFARYYTPGVVILAVFVFLITKNLDTAITVLVLACPGALVIGAPIANVAGIGRGAKQGVLLKGGDSVHTFVRTDTIVFDKTGTLTKGEPEVIKEVAYGCKEEDALLYAASLETVSNHPLGNCILAYAKNKGLTLIPPTKAEPVKGQGIRGIVEEKEVIVGNKRLMETKNVTLPLDLLESLKTTEEASLVFVAIDGIFSMFLAISDAIKEDAKDSIASLRSLGIKNLVMLTGDNEKTAKAVSDKLGLDKVKAELLPKDKLDIIRDMQNEGHVVTFVGDGINDSPALTASDIGIAMGTGTDAAIDCSDVVLIKSDLKSVSVALNIAKKTVAIMYENILIAISTVFLLLVGLFAGYIHMGIGMLIHEASILLVILNAMRIFLINDSEKSAVKK